MEEVKELQNHSAIDNLKLFIFQELQKGRILKEIKKETGLKDNAFQYHLTTLKRLGFVKKIGYGVWETTTKINPKELQKSSRVATITPYKICSSLKQDSVRGHAFQFKLQLPENLRNWNKREHLFLKIGLKFKELRIFGGGQSIELNGRKIHLTDKSIIIYEKQSFISETAKESQSQAINHFLKLIKQLERKLHANFSNFGKYRFKVSRQHYSLIKNALAKQYNEAGERLEIYNDKGLWFLIDNSFNLNEAEAVHPKTSQEDIDNKVLPFFNSLKEKPITTHEIHSNFQEFKGMFKTMSENEIQIGQVMQQMENNLLRLSKVVYGIRGKRE